MISLRYLRENNVKISEYCRLKLFALTISGLSLPLAEETAPGNNGDIPAESERAGICMNTAPLMRI